jgi:DNA-binding transcriptional LysR family regulator
MNLLSLTVDFLRTLVVATDLGGFGRAAVALGRSQSAVSLQMRKLEETLGEPLFRKEGRNLGLTATGDMVLSYARHILELNDAVFAATRGMAVQGSVRFGVPQDFGDAWLPGVLARFNRAHPGVMIEARVDRTDRLIHGIGQGGLDLALVWGDTTSPNATPVGRLPMTWIGPKGYRYEAESSVALAVFELPCVFRQPAVEALEQAQIPWRLAFASPSLAGLWAAAEAGLGVTVRTAFGLPPQLSVLGAASGLPDLPEIGLALYMASSEPSPAVIRLREILIEELSAALIAAKPRSRKRAA